MSRTSTGLSDAERGQGSYQPLEIVRFSKLGAYIPVGRTTRDELIKQGLLEVVPLTPAAKRKNGRVTPGRALGITMRSIRRYQALVMGLADTSNKAG